jgi:1-deoxy-D-xylulose-5-phosphate synthase
MGGFGSAVLEFAAENDLHAKVRRLGIPDEVIEHGEQSELYRECGFDAAGIVKTALEMAEIVRL